MGLFFRKWQLRKSTNLVVITIVVVIIAVLAYQGMNMRYDIENGKIKINWFTGVTVPIRDISQVTILDNSHKMTKMVGVELLNLRQGTFSIEGIGRVKLYAGDIRRKLVLLKTEKITYGITPENPEQFVRWIGKK